MSSPTSVIKGSSSADPRARLLHRLGIYDAPSSVKVKTFGQPLTAAEHRRHRILRGMGVGYTLQACPPDGSATRNRLLEGVQKMTEKLKVDDLPEKPTRVAFRDDVEVVPIPTRYEYSDRIKSRIWSSRHELQENAERNAIEFASEGWNWRNVTEDDGMYICSQSGELVHPIHLQHLVEQEEPEESSSEDRALERGAPVHSS